MNRVARIALSLALCVGTTAALAAAADPHVKQDIERHRAMAAAHDAAAKCLEAGKSEEVCGQELQQRCKGLAIGKYCGMKHEH
jgi:hypothetical protein